MEDPVAVVPLRIHHENAARAGVNGRRVDAAQAEEAIQLLLEALGEDPARPGLRDTARRAARVLQRDFRGVGRDPAEPLEKYRDHDRSQSTGGIVLLPDLPFRSVCEHHLTSFGGFAGIAYAPNGVIAGIGSIAAALDIAASRPQMQERIGQAVVDAVVATLAPIGVTVVLTARHFCSGDPAVGVPMTTAAGAGVLPDGVRDVLLSRTSQHAAR